MRKIFLFLIVAGALSFAFSLESKAYTFNGSYDFSNIDLNASINELNGASLNDLFDYDYLETLPLIEWNGYRNKFEVVNGAITFNEYVYIDLGYKNLFNGYLSQNAYDLANGQFISGGINYTSAFDFVSIYPNKTYTISNSANLNTVYLLQYDENYNYLGWSVGGSPYTFSLGNDTHYIRFTYTDSYIANVDIQIEEGNTVTDYKPYGVLSEVYRLNTIPISNNDLVQSLYLYNLENINIDLLNYYFAVFLLNAYDLPVGDLWSYAWTAGNDAGYNNGFDDGYDSGYDNGFNTGNSQGYTSGYNFGYNTGFDDGILSEVDTQWLLGFVTGTINVLGVSIIPGISLGVFVFIPLFLGFIGFIFRLGGRRG